MSWIAPLDIGLAMGLIFAFPVLSLAVAFRLLNFADLTIEGALPLGAAAFGASAVGGLPLLLSIALALLAGMLAGGSTALIHSVFGVNKFLAGVIVIAISYSLSLRIMGTSNIGLLQVHTLFDAAQNFDLKWPFPIHVATSGLLAVMVGATGLALWLWLSSRSGIRTRVAGTSPEYARALGISAPLRLVVGLALCNAMAAAGGALLAMYQGFSDASLGQGVLVVALASVTLGERLLPKESLSFPLFVICAGILGSLVYQTLVAYAVWFGVAPTDLRLITALLVLSVVVVRSVRREDEFLEALR